MGLIGPAFVAQMATLSPVVALVSNRIYPENAKIADDIYPLIEYQISNVTTSSTYDGPANPLRSCNIVVTCIAQTYAAADALADAVLALDGTDGTWGDTTVQGCFLNEDSITDGVIQNAETEDIMLYTKELSFMVWYVR
jgi:hypothetical protein